MRTYAGYGHLGVDRGDYALALRYAGRAIGQVPWDTAGWKVLGRLAKRLIRRGSRSGPASAGDADG
jgi:hypothetical protein